MIFIYYVYMILSTIPDHQHELFHMLYHIILSPKEPKFDYMLFITILYNEDLFLMLLSTLIVLCSFDIYYYVIV